MVMKLVYWDLRALGEQIRYMLEYLDVEYENVYPNTRPEWYANKHTYGVDLPNLPYLIDGDVKISQSLAITRYLSRKFKTLGAESEEEEQKIDVAEGFCTDLRWDFIRLWFNTEYQTKRVDYFNNLPDKLRSLETVLARHKWAVGSKLTHVDFNICEFLDFHEMCEPGCLDSSPNVKRYYQDFFALPKIAAYRKSDRFHSWPISGGFILGIPPQWGGEGQQEKK